MFPLAVQSSISLVGNTNTGNATSRSKLVSAGRRLIVTTTDVFDDTGRLLTKVDTTYLVAATGASHRLNRGANTDGGSF
jgi:acyl-coenzyme A thioesterase PaaI-like protein